MADNPPRVGKIIYRKEVRDAIHVAVAPVVATDTLQPGDRIGFVLAGNYESVGKTSSPIGIVDPFLTEPVRIGQTFWMFLFPGTIVSLRHQWAHPAFGDELVGDRAVAEAWIKNFANKISQSYEHLMDAAEVWVDREDYTYSGSNEGYKDATNEEWETFWTHYETLTGRAPRDGERGSFFSCSC